MSALLLLGQWKIQNPFREDGGFAPPLEINPRTVGAAGFTPWLTPQAPMLTYGEKVVLSKVGNGIGSAAMLAGTVPDLKKITEIGPQELLQLTSGFPFRAAAVPSAGFAGI